MDICSKGLLLLGCLPMTLVVLLYVDDAPDDGDAYV
jgi:hypothetical protein